MREPQQATDHDESIDHLNPDEAGEASEDAASGELRGAISSPPLHVVLYHPEIPPNTGNIGRTCVALSAQLWLVRPLGFDISDAAIRRSGLDYWQHLELNVVDDWDQLCREIRRQTDGTMWFCSRHARRTVWDVEFKRGDIFVFGCESSGLPESILDPDGETSLRLPTDAKVRSLNLATTAGVFMYEHARQISQGT